MPPKVKITKEDIVQTAIHLVREGGEQSVNARAIAGVLHCSTQPIFSNFRSMEELDAATVQGAYEIYLQFLKNETDAEQYPPYKAMGMAYIRFAKEERELFKLLFMRDRTEEDTSPSQDFKEAVRMIMKSSGVTAEKATLMHLEIWACVHGIGTMLATSFLPLEWELISDMLTDVYQGVRSRHLSEV